MGRIYSGWKIVETVPHEARLMGYALDFGFDPDPACIIAIYWYNGGFILHEILYQTELLNSHLISTFKALPKAPIIADSAEPKSIAELQAAGLNVVPCMKGADSVHAGIKHVQGQPISYTRSSTNLHNEYENYSWKVTKDGETVGIEDPKKPNHAMSAVRYGLTELAAACKQYDRHQKERDAVQVTVTRRKLQKIVRGKMVRSTWQGERFDNDCKYNSLRNRDIVIEQNNYLLKTFGALGSCTVCKLLTSLRQGEFTSNSLYQERPMALGERPRASNLAESD